MSEQIEFKPIAIKIEGQVHHLVVERSVTREELEARKVQPFAACWSHVAATTIANALNEYLSEAS